MAIINWKTGVGGAWDTGTLWSSNTVPTSSDDVSIDAAAVTPGYVVAIGPTDSLSVNSLTMNAPNDVGAVLDINGGTLSFANQIFGDPLTGNFLGSLQTVVDLNNATINNVGTINAFIQATGNDFFTGSNPIYFTDYLQSLGNVTINTNSIGEITGSTLFDGIFEAKGTGTSINFGGQSLVVPPFPVPPIPIPQNNIVNITTIAGPPLVPNGFTEVIFDQPDSAITEWNGTSYVSIETSLTDIAAGGTLDVQQGRDYTTTNALSVDNGGVFNLQAGAVSTGGLTIGAGGAVQGSATIESTVTNNGTLEALAGTPDIAGPTGNGTLVVTGSLLGTGVIDFDHDLKNAAALNPIGAKLEVHSVAAGQQVVLNGDDTLQMDNAAAFAGTLSAQVGDTLVLQGLSATSAVISGSNLLVKQGNATLATIALSGNYAGKSFSSSVSGGTTTLVLGNQGTPVVSGVPATQTGTDSAPVSPFSSATVSDSNNANPLAASIVVSAGATPTDADGILTSVAPVPGLTKTGVGTYSFLLTNAAGVTADLQALRFTPTAHQVAPGNAVTTQFALSVTDGTATATGNTSVAVTAQNTMPTVTGLLPTQSGADTATLAPFGAVMVTDPDFGAATRATIVLTAGAVPTDADGTLSGGGLTKTGAGSYALIATSPANLTAELQALVFTPTAHQVAPGSSVTTHVALSVAEGDMPNNLSSNLVVTAQATAPAITGLPATEVGVYGAGFTPFANTTVSDPDLGAATSAGIILTVGGVASDANGVLAGSGLTKTDVGTYTLAATSPATLTSELHALVFNSTIQPGTPGSSLTTGMGLTVHEGELTASASTTVTTTLAEQEFDANYYLNQNPDVAASGIDPAVHYAEYGWKEGRNPDPYFNTHYYLNQNPDVAAAGVDPLTHYQEFGWHEGRDPSNDFSTSQYLQANQDVVAANIDPLYHFLQYGASEGRMAFIAQPHGTGTQNPLVDNSYYYMQNPDVAASGLDPFTHYDTSGWHEGRNPDALFNTSYYLQQNSDVTAAGVDPLLQYEQYGWKEGRNPSAAFDTNAYLAHNPDVAAAGIDPLVHYEQYGMAEGRAIYPVPT